MQNYILILNRASILPKKIVCDLIFFFLRYLDGLICYVHIYIKMTTFTAYSVYILPYSSKC